MKKFKPTTPTRRHQTVVDYSIISTNVPLKALTMKVQNHAGRNNRGRISVRHQGGGHKRTYRIIDFKQDRFDIPSKIEHIEYDPYRTCFIARVVYADGKRTYILATKNMKVGDTVITSNTAPKNPGNRMALKNIPVGYQVCNIEIHRGAGSKLARSAGSYVEILAHANGYTDLKMPSREIRKVSSESLGTIGQMSNDEWGLVSIGKAGRNRWLGIRPTVRGTAMNAVDHPYGGGEQRQPRGTKRPKTMWGKVTGGRKTRDHKKYSNKLIVKRRTKKAKK